MELDEDEAFLPIAHFHKVCMYIPRISYCPVSIYNVHQAPGNTFGTPFVIVVKNVSVVSLSNALSVT